MTPKKDPKPVILVDQIRMNFDHNEVNLKEFAIQFGLHKSYPIVLERHNPNSTFSFFSVGSNHAWSSIFDMYRIKLLLSADSCHK